MLNTCPATVSPGMAITVLCILDIGHATYLSSYGQPRHGDHCALHAGQTTADLVHLQNEAGAFLRPLLEIVMKLEHKCTPHIKGRK